SSRQPELMEHRAEQARAEFFFAVLQRRKPVAIVESPVTALAGATVEGNGHPTDAAEPSDFSLELMARHIHGSHISVRFSSHGWDLAARVKKIDQPPVSSRRTIAAPAASAFNLAKARSRGMYFMPQSGAGISRSGGRCVRAARMRAATVSGVSGSGSPMLITPKITVLLPRSSRVARSRLGWAASIEICSTRVATSSGRNA